MTDPFQINDVIHFEWESMEFEFEVHTGWIRNVRFNGVEIVRAIYGAVRDRDWNTIPVKIAQLQKSVGEEEFRIEYVAECESGPISFRWLGRILGTPQGLSYEFDGLARSQFEKNRIGLCVLHPAEECAGRACKIRHSSQDDTAQPSVTEFPSAISPHQPFFDVKAMEIGFDDRSGKGRPEFEVEIRFDGDTFETEDQRNWTDASFKTYSTPLAQPFPVTVEQGTEIKQRVDIAIVGKSQSRKSRYQNLLATHFLVEGKGTERAFEPDTVTTRPRPKIGFVLGEDDIPTGNVNGSLNVDPDHFRIEFGTDNGVSLAAYERNLKFCALRQVPVELVLRFDEADFEPTEIESSLMGEADEFAPIAIDRFSKLDPQPTIARYLILPKRGHMEALPRILQKFRALRSRLNLPNAPVFSGTDAYFAELNRERPPMESLDGVAFTINPTVHADDPRSIVETIAMHQVVVENARRIAGGKSVVVSPVSFRPRFNPNATSSSSLTSDRASSSPVMPRSKPIEKTRTHWEDEHPNFVGAWGLGCFIGLTEGGAESATFAWPKVVRDAQLPRLIGKTPEEALAIFEKFLAQIDSWGWLAIRDFPRAAEVPSPAPEKVRGLLLEDDRERRVLFVNFTNRGQWITVLSRGSWRDRPSGLASTMLHSPWRAHASRRENPAAPEAPILHPITTSVPLGPHEIRIFDWMINESGGQSSA